DNFYPLYVTGFSTATWAGVAVALGAAAEVLFMARGTGVLRSLGPARALTLSYLVSALRWVVLAYARSVPLVVLAQLAHALTFGAYYMAAVGMVDAESPPEVRVSAQGIYNTVAF